ncbi:amidohydrolase [Rhizobium rhizogenes]|jgi:aminobenzoyl-glutamate utilization protein B|uniref:Peptidase M20 n=2 Tax=Rhizobium/Agrobacterium group TaxID=227290 RepID=A0AB36EHX0_AGRTU|nr:MULTISPECIES: M20 family metallopeptidase [Rhizobium/Agrobacterium group]AHK03221.1 catalyzes the cleavage of p-aminobenzoyl-glutamate to p-aminobenzoate and glutamate [Agrobacterium tumefaciens LBA4213 (Ach5)]AKC08999.1 amidohydrolase [Agrobacterium tumefaciens]EHJ99996.1 amidohydrolase [Agrobacterium tumefaciens 5A]AYM18142.1 aminobenzoyl-glutamate utilization protein B [Agrobacterium tumefaciens]AYM69441.1 aminobenzoyl-glutamate utilization protein B [Agrobacterium tumefaciens]
MNREAVMSIAAEIESMKPHFTTLSDSIWDFAELKFEERQSAGVLANALEENGFVVRRGVAGMDTAFIGEFGHGKPVIAFLGEFDALAGMSQMAGVAEAKPLQPDASGHGCGHNLLGVGSLMAAIALARHLKANNLPGTVRYYGCPGEEGGSGKTFMVRAGLFDDVDAALTWHPAPFNGVRSTNNLAVLEYFYRFKGVASHASNAAHLGRSALDAVELMNVGVNFLREHMPQDCRVHYAITDAGGKAANVVQAKAEVLYLIRAPEMRQALDLAARVDKVARGAAMMTETEVEIVFDTASTNLLPNITLETAMHENMVALGPIAFDEADQAFAKVIQDTFTEEAIKSSIRLYQIKGDVFSNGKIDGSTPLHLGLRDFEGQSHFRAGSTDVGDVSWVTPTAQCWTPAWAIGTNPHTWQVVAQGKSPAAHKAMAHAAKTLASTGLSLMTSPELLESVKKEWLEKTEGSDYVCPIPADVMPGFHD